MSDRAGRPDTSAPSSSSHPRSASQASQPGRSSTSTGRTSGERIIDDNKINSTSAFRVHPREASARERHAQEAALKLIKPHPKHRGVQPAAAAAYQWQAAVASLQDQPAERESRSPKTGGTSGASSRRSSSSPSGSASRKSSSSPSRIASPIDPSGLPFANISIFSPGDRTASPSRINRSKPGSREASPAGARLAAPQSGTPPLRRQSSTLEGFIVRINGIPQYRQSNFRPFDESGWTPHLVGDDLVWRHPF